VNVNENRLLLRGLRHLSWCTSKEGFARLRFAQLLPLILFGQARSWRGKNRRLLEEFWGCLFTEGLSRGAQDHVWQYAYGELREHIDTDLWVRAAEKRPEAQWNYRPVQLKEFVPAELNDDATFQEILNKITYNDPELVVVIVLNRPTTIRFVDLKPPPGRIGQLWLVGKSETGRFIFGDALNNPKRFDFSDPVSGFFS